MLVKLIGGLVAIAALGQPAIAHAEGTPSVVVEKKVGAGWVFTDQKGMSLYTFGQDKPGQSKCVGPCAEIWPPVLAASDMDTAGSADWSIVNRSDGMKQIAYRAMPLYNYVKDPVPGTTFGEGVAGAWRVAGRDVETPPGIAISRSADGRVMTESRGRTLYFNEDDKPQFRQTADLSGKLGVSTTVKLKSACTKHCLESWEPLMAPSVAVASDDWSIVVREDGVRQWAFQQRPLYAPISELNIADGRQDRLWHVALVEPPPPLPTWVKYQSTDGGEVATNAAGFTIYALVDNPKAQDWKSSAACEAECIRTYWRPVAAAADAKPVGNWTIVKGFDGANQWAYKGELLFTHTRDTQPRELAGSRFFTRAWHTLTRSGEEMEGMDKR